MTSRKLLHQNNDETGLRFKSSWVLVHVKEIEAASLQTAPKLIAAGQAATHHTGQQSLQGNHPTTDQADQFQRFAFLAALLVAPALLNDLALSFFMRALSAFDICSRTHRKNQNLSQNLLVFSVTKA